MQRSSFECNYNRRINLENMKILLYFISNIFLHNLVPMQVSIQSIELKFEFTLFSL